MMVTPSAAQLCSKTTLADPSRTSNSRTHLNAQSVYKSATLRRPSKSVSDSPKSGT